MGSASGKTWVYVLLAIVVLLGLAYFDVGVLAQREIDDAWAQRQAEKPPLLDDKAAATGAGPYHLAIRYGNQTLAMLVEESVTRKMATAPPAGDMGDKIKVGKLEVVSAKAAFPEDATGVMKATVQLTGTLTVEVSRRIRALRAPGANTVPIAPVAAVRVKMSSELKDGRPALIITILSVDSFELNASAGALLPASVQARVREMVRKKLEAQLTDPGNEASRRVLSLPEKFGKGDLPIQLVDAGLTIIPGADGEMFLGLKTNLNAEPQITAEARGAPLGAHTWGLTLGDNTLSVILRAFADQGRIPSHFNRQGDPDPEGTIVFDVERATLSPDGFVIASRIWNLAFPAFWRHFDVHGKMTMQDGRIAPELGQMVGGEGGGNTWLGDLIEDRLQSAPRASMSSGGKSVPPRMPLPMSGGERALQLNVEEVVTGDHFMTVMGSSEVVDNTPAAAAPEAAPDAAAPAAP